MTVSGEKAPISGKITNVCKIARMPRIDPHWVQVGTVAGGGLVVSNSLPSGGRPAKVGAGVPCRNTASVAIDGSATSRRRRRIGRDQPQPGPRAGSGHGSGGAGQRSLDGPGR